jgi:hypothetical protein
MENNTSRRIIRISKKKIGIALIILVIIAFVVYAYNINRPHYYGGMEDGAAIPQFDVGAGTSGAPSDYRGGMYYGGQPDVTDTREFLKTSYSSQIKTRDVRDAVKRVKGAVREAQGRVDSETSGPKYGYINFVVPKAKFESFRDEVESITHKKLYTENVSSQNLLGQKQNIDQQMNQATSSLADLEKQKSDLTTKHNQKMDAYRQELAGLQEGIVNYNKQLQNTEDEESKTFYIARIASLQQGIELNQKNQSAEIKNYNSQNQILTAQIKYAKDSVNNVEKRDDQFMDNIETVSGYVSVNWISYWDMATLISPIHPTIIIIILVLIALYFLNRKGYIPKVEFV